MSAKIEKIDLGGPVALGSSEDPRINKEGAISVERSTFETENASVAEVLATDLVVIDGSALINTSSNPKTNTQKSSAATKGYFIAPTTGWNWGRLHDNNAVDIANVCGTPIYAAAEGLVIENKSEGWNDGYGNYLEIEHPNGVNTRYAHLSSNVAQLGQYVKQGDLVAKIGNTGNTHGPTGCHLHFEVRGGVNPLAK